MKWSIVFFIASQFSVVMSIFDFWLSWRRKRKGADKSDDIGFQIGFSLTWAFIFFWLGYVIYLFEGGML